MIDQSRIRNFCIIAHIDHGKSTLADRIIEKTGTLTSREMQDQVLDNMELERERGITIKSQAVRIVYKAQDGEEYIFNLIDTPGHVDFNYEVSRALAACEGAILVVDAAQGVEAQTLANVYMAIDHDLEVMPVINKIDLPSADPDRAADEIEDIIGIEAHDAPRISAKNGINIEEVLEQIITKIPAPQGDPDAPLKALIFDSLYDPYKGVIAFFRIMDGSIRKGQRVRMMATGSEFETVEVGYFGAGRLIPCDELGSGMVGYMAASIKTLQETRVGDTITDADHPCDEPLPGYKKVNPMVYCGIFPEDGAKYPELRDALEKLQLNDASLFFEPETSVALGFGFRCGFLGLLHLEIVTERAEAFRTKPSGTVFLDVPLLFETDAWKLCDEIWFVTARQETRIDRVMAREHCNREDVLARIASQMPEEEKRGRSDVVIDNSRGMAELLAQLDELLAQSE